MVVPEGVGPIQPSNERSTTEPARSEVTSGEIPNAGLLQESTVGEQQPVGNVASPPVEGVAQPSLSVLQPEEKDIVGMEPGGLYWVMRKMRERKKGHEEEERRKRALPHAQESGNELPKAA